MLYFSYCNKILLFIKNNKIIIIILEHDVEQLPNRCLKLSTWFVNEFSLSTKKHKFPEPYVFTNI